MYSSKKVIVNHACKLKFLICFYTNSFPLHKILLIFEKSVPNFRSTKPNDAMVCYQNCYSTEWLPLNFLYIILGGGKVERLKSTISTDHSSDTSQQVGFLYQMTKRSELSGLNDNPSDQKCDVKTDTPQAAEPRKTSIPFISKFS